MYRLRVIVPFERRALHLLINWKPSGPNLLDELLKAFIVNPTNLPRKGVKILATLCERVNHDSWVKMYNLYRVFKKLVYLCSRHMSGLGDIYSKDDDACYVNMFIYLSFMLCINYAYINHVVMGLYAILLLILLDKYDIYT